LLKQYQPNEDENSSLPEERQSALLSAVLLQSLTDKKFQYKDHPVKFIHDFDRTS